jgi:hypothetical protein
MKKQVEKIDEYSITIKVETEGVRISELASTPTGERITITGEFGEMREKLYEQYRGEDMYQNGNKTFVNDFIDDLVNYQRGNNKVTEGNGVLAKEEQAGKIVKGCCNAILIIGILVFILDLSFLFLVYEIQSSSILIRIMVAASAVIVITIIAVMLRGLRRLSDKLDNLIYKW